MKPNWFVGIPIPANSWLDGILSGLPPNCRGFHPDDLHMTLAFFGNLEAAKTQTIIEAVNQIQTKPFKITLGRLRPLPSEKKFSALSFEVDTGFMQAKSLIATWRDPLIQLAGARPDFREPLPHITIARPLRKAGREDRKNTMAWARNLVPPGNLLPVDRVALYTWSEDRRTRQFKKVAEKLFTPGCS